MPPLPAPFRTRSAPAAAAAALGLLLAAAAPPAAAQVGPATPPSGPAGACGQPLALTYQLAQPLDRAAPAPVAVALDRQEPRYVEFTLASPAEVTLRTRSATGTDTFLALFDSAGRAIVTDDDSGGNLQAMIERVALAPGAYCAQVRTYGWSEPVDAQASLELTVVAVAAPPATTARPCGDPALTVDVGRLLAPGFGTASFTATVAPQSRRDWRMTVAAPLTLRIEATSPMLDTMLWLHDAAGTLIAENDDRPQGGTDSELVEALAPGDYCISVTGYAGAGGPAQLVLTEVAAAAPAPAPGLPSPAPIPGPIPAPIPAPIPGPVPGPIPGPTPAPGAPAPGLPGAPGLIPTPAPVPPPGFIPGAAPAPAPASDPSLPCGDAALTRDAGSFGPGAAGWRDAARVEPGGRRDWTLRLAAPARLTLEALGSEGLDTILALHDATGTMIAENDDRPQGGTDSELILALEPGAYCASVRGFAGGGGVAELVVTPEAALAPPAPPPGAPSPVTPAPSAELPDRPGPQDEVAGLGTVSEVAEAMRSSAAATQWYGFAIAQPGAFRLQGLSMGGPVVLRVTGPQGLLAEARGEGGFDIALVDLELAPGDYLVALHWPAPPARAAMRQLVVTRR